MEINEKIDKYVLAQGNQVGSGAELAGILKEMVEEMPGPPGPQGPQGPQGNTGSSVDYPFELINNLTTDDPEKGLSAAQGVVLKGEISQLGQEINGNDTETIDPTTLGAVQGQYYNGSIQSYLTTRVCFSLEVDGYTKVIITPLSGYRVSVVTYSGVPASDTIISADTNWTEDAREINIENNVKYITCNISTTSGSDDISPSDIATMITVTAKTQAPPGLLQRITGVEKTLYVSAGEDIDVTRVGAITGQYYRGELQVMNTRVCFSLDVSNYGKVVFTPLQNYKIALATYNGSPAAGTFIEQDTEWTESGSRECVIKGTSITYITCNIAATNGSDTISPDNIASMLTVVADGGDGLVEKVGKLSAKFEETGSFVIGPDCLKRNVNVERIGSLKYLQAFCIYDGKYYSTDGTHIAEQDAQFNLLRDVSINIGHGNSLQLVSNGKAWASGWDDRTMYRVDLSTLSVDTTVTLPKPGFSTVAVNEDNGYMYIFNRQTYPTTVAQYEFIVYDYINAQTISTRKIESFAAQQSVEYFEGKIITLYGFGTVAAPSGMVVYNTAGDILARFVLEIFKNTEPEGIAIDRDTYEMFVSEVSKNIYKVSLTIQ